MALEWLPLPAYLELTKETEEAIKLRIRRGHWLRGVHVTHPSGSKNLWVSLKAVNDWAASEKPAHLHGDGK